MPPTKQDKKEKMLPPQLKIVYIKQLRLKLMQQSLIYCLCFWLLSYPLKLRQINLFFYQFLYLLTIALALSFCFFCIQRAFNPYLFNHTVGQINVIQAKKTRNLSCFFSGLFIVLHTLYHIKTHIAQQADQAWPELAAVPLLNLFIPWLLPFYSLLIPLIFNLLLSLILKYEVKDSQPK